MLAPWNQDLKIMEASAEHDFSGKRLGEMFGVPCILCFWYEIKYLLIIAKIVYGILII